MISISSAFDSGNIEVSSIDGDNIQLKVRDDPFSEFEQKTFKQVCVCALSLLHEASNS